MKRWEQVIGNPLVIVAAVAAVGLGVASLADVDPVLRPGMQPEVAAARPGTSPRVREVIRSAQRMPLEDRPAYLARVLADPTLPAEDAGRIREAEFLTWATPQPGN